jgi:hypothetical protein
MGLELALMGLTKVKVNKKGVGELLKGKEVQADLERRGRQIAAAAGPGHEVQTYVGKNRARVTVRTATHAARLAEARTRSLTRAFDAGRR